MIRASMCANSPASIDYSILKRLIKDLNLGDFLTLQGHQLHRNKACCPFCGSGTGKHKTPAFHIFPDNHFRCFSCQAHGDIIAFVMQLQGLEFASAIEFIAKEMGIQIPELLPGQPTKVIKIQVGSRLVFDQGKNSIVEVPKYRCFRDREEADIILKKNELELEEKMCRVLALIGAVLAEGDEVLELIVETAGNDFEKKYFSLMKDKRWAFGKIIEWRNKNLNKKDK